MENFRKLNKSEVIELMKTMGASDKKLASLAFETNAIPDNGIFGNIASRAFNPSTNDDALVTDENKEQLKTDGYTIYPVMEVVDDNFNVITHVSINRIFAQIASKLNETDAEIRKIENPKSAHKGKYMVVSTRLNDLGKFNARSVAEAIGKLPGERFTAKPSEYPVSVYKDDMSHFSANQDTVKKMWEVKKLHVIDIAS